jgi:hypothetical protein
MLHRQRIERSILAQAKMRERMHIRPPQRWRHRWDQLTASRPSWTHQLSHNL